MKVFGYVYLITNIKNNMKYLGRKLLKNPEIDPLKDGYWGTSYNPEYWKDFKSHRNYFKKEILYLGEDFREKELEYLMYYNADKNKEFYNIQISRNSKIPNGVENTKAINKDGKILFIDECKLDFFLNRGWGLGMGIIWITNGSENKRWKINEKIPDGYYQGMVPSNKNKICMHNKNEIIYVEKDEEEHYNSLGFIRGNFKISTHASSKLTMTNGKENIRVNLEDFEYYKNLGYSGFSVAKNRIWINKQGKTKMINKEDLQSYLEEGYSLGRK